MYLLNVNTFLVDYMGSWPRGYCYIISNTLTFYCVGPRARLTIDLRLAPILRRKGVLCLLLYTVVAILPSVSSVRFD